MDAAVLDAVPLPESPLPDAGILRLLAQAPPPLCGARLQPLLLVAYLLSPGHAERLLQIAPEPQPQMCHWQVMRYLLRSGSTEAERILRAAPWEMDREPGLCQATVLRGVRFGPHPLSDELAMAYLHHAYPQWISSAASALQQRGSARTKPALRNAIAETGKAIRRLGGQYNDDLRRLMSLQQTLLPAFAMAEHWWTTEEELREIVPLCADFGCERVVGDMLNAWQPLTLAVELLRTGSGTSFRAYVAQYWNIQSRQELLHRFRLSPSRPPLVLQVTSNLSEVEHADQLQVWERAVQAEGFPVTEVKSRKIH